MPDAAGGARNDPTAHRSDIFEEAEAVVTEVRTDVDGWTLNLPQTTRQPLGGHEPLPDRPLIPQTVPRRDLLRQGQRARRQEPACGMRHRSPCSAQPTPTTSSQPIVWTSTPNDTAKTVLRPEWLRLGHRAPTPAPVEGVCGGSPTASDWIVRRPASNRTTRRPQPRGSPTAPQDPR